MFGFSSRPSAVLRGEPSDRRCSMRQQLVVLMTAVLTVVGLFGSPEDAQSCPRRYRAARYYPGPAYAPCYPQPYPCYPGEIVAASATIFVHVPADAKLYVDGKPVEGTGSMRVVTTGTIPIGQELVVTLCVDVKGKGKELAGDDAEVPPKDPEDPGPKPPSAAADSDKGGSITKKVCVRAFQCVHVDLTTK
jgi:uncharacterized protein (TIGR03000 family)